MKERKKEIMKIIKIKNSYKKGCFYVIEHFNNVLTGEEGKVSFKKNFKQIIEPCFKGFDGRWYRLTKYRIYNDTVYFAELQEVSKNWKIT